MAKLKSSASPPRVPNSALTTAPKTKKAVGGTAASGGTKFQAVVTAIAGAHLLCGKLLGWLAGVADDKWQLPGVAAQPPE